MTMSLDNKVSGLVGVEKNVEAKLHGESRVIQRCFDDNKDDNKGWWQMWWQKAQRSIKEWVQDIQDRIKNTSRIKRKVEFKNEESRFKRSRFKTQDSRIKRRLNQDKYEKVFSKIE